MLLKIAHLVSIFLSALVMGVYWGPWVALSRSFRTFEPDVFLAVVRRMSQNLAPLMTVLAPVALLSVVPVLFLSYRTHPQTFFLSLMGLALFLVALVVTVGVEVPIVQRIEVCTVSTLPDDWPQLRDRWVAFHLIRVGASAAGLVLLLIGAIF